MPSELIKLLALYVITFVLMHIFEKINDVAFRSHKKYVSIFLSFVVKHCNSKESKLTDAVSLFNSTAQLDQMSV